MRRRTLGWVSAIVLIIGTLVASIILNISHDNANLSKVENSLIIDNGDQKINWNRYQTTTIRLSTSIEITKSGVYHLTGELENGSVTIKTPSNGEVKLILDNATIKNSSGPAIICASADDLVIELIGENYLADGKTYNQGYDADITGTIYSKADTIFQGDGSLVLDANYQDGIISKDDLKFISGTYDISANDDAIRGKDSVYILNGDFTVLANADGIKSTNDQDQGKGFVLIENGNFNFKTSAKGIKSTRSIFIYGGEFALETTDDTIHSDNFIGILGGNISIASGDDGIHANSELSITDGKINISKAYEGLEAQVVTINGGDISLMTTDDGINAGGGADSSAQNRKGAGAFNADENCILSINGGNLYVNAAGDGVDSNGWLYFNGGNTIIDGPTNSGNSALDSGMGIVINGGSVLALGSSGMAENLGNTSSVNNVSIFLSEATPKNTLVEIKNSAGDTLFSHTSAKSFNHIAAGSPSFNLGETYTLYLDGEETETFIITGTVTTVGNGSQQMMPGNQNFKNKSEN